MDLVVLDFSHSHQEFTVSANGIVVDAFDNFTDAFEDAESRADEFVITDSAKAAEKVLTTHYADEQNEDIYASFDYDSFTDRFQD